MPQNLVTLSTVIFGAIAAWNVIIALMKGRRSHLRDEYRFAKEFINDLDGVAKSSLYIQQKGAHALTGIIGLDIGTLRYLLNQPEPLKSIRNFSLGQKYIDFVANDTKSPLKFADKFKSDAKRLWIKISWLILYLLFYALAWLPFILGVKDHASYLSWGPKLLVSILMFGPLAVWAVVSGQRLSRAEELIKNQRPN